MAARRCSKTSCNQRAVATLTYVYADSTAVLGPLATFAEPHCYDLCEDHSKKLTAPRGWDVLRLETSAETLKPALDDIEALANAVREVNRSDPEQLDPGAFGRVNLRVVRDQPSFE